MYQIDIEVRRKAAATKIRTWRIVSKTPPLKIIENVKEQLKVKGPISRTMLFLKKSLEDHNDSEFRIDQQHNFRDDDRAKEVYELNITLKGYVEYESINFDLTFIDYRPLLEDKNIHTIINCSE